MRSESRMFPAEPNIRIRHGQRPPLSSMKNKPLNVPVVANPREMIEQGADSEYLERGEGVYVVVYCDGRPDEIYFAGLSYD